MFAALKPSILIAAIAVIIHHATAFAPVNLNNNKCSTSSCALFAERREILNTAVISLMGGLAVAGPAWATDDDGVVDDLAMPIAEEAKATDVRSVLYKAMPTLTHRFRIFSFFNMESYMIFLIYYIFLFRLWFE